MDRKVVKILAENIVKNKKFWLATTAIILTASKIGPQPLGPDTNDPDPF